jgi:hypothetical protein
LRGFGVLNIKTWSAHYWDTVARKLQSSGKQSLWRVHSDAVNVALCARWLPKGRMKHLLKTDLFDEAVTDGGISISEIKGSSGWHGHIRLDRA